MNRAIVLGGGGSRGSYELGAWEALSEAGQSFDGFYGTSIGAINAALMAQGDISLAQELWDTLTVDQVMVDGVNLEKDISRMLDQRRELLTFLRKYAQKRGADIAPLVARCRGIIDEERIRAGGKSFGLVTVKFPSLTPVYARLPQIPSGMLVDYLMASAACFPAFPMWQMNGESYIDGGYQDNLPLDMALLDGAEEIVAVELRDEKICHPAQVRQPYVTYIHPSWPLGGFLVFEQSLMQRNRRMGYLDAMKALGRLDGLRYAFHPIARAELMPLARRYALMVARAEAGAAGQNRAPVSEVLMEGTGRDRLDYIDFLLRGGELCAQLMEVEPVAVYDAMELHRTLRERVLAQPPVWSEERPLRFLARCTSRAAAIACLRQVILEKGPFTPAQLREMCAWPRELAAALWLIARERVALDGEI